MIREPKVGGPEAPADVAALLRPQGLAGGIGQLTFGFAAIVGLAVLYLIEVATPKDFSVTALSIFPMLAVAWLCGPRTTLSVFLCSVVFHILLAFEGEVSFARMGVHISADALIAVVGRVASVSLASVRDSRERELSVLLEVARKLSQAFELREVLDQVASATAAFFAQRGGGLVEVFRVEDGYATVVAEQGAGEAALLNARFPTGISARQLAQATSAVVLDAADLGPELRARLGAETQRIAAAPIRAGASTTGFLTVAGGPGRLFSSADLRVLEGIADLAGIAIESGTRLEAERRRVLTFQTLHEVATAVAGAASPRDVAGVVVRKAAELVDAETAVLAWQERKGDLLRVLASQPEGIAAAFQTREGIIGRAFLEGQPVVAHGPEELSSASDLQIAGDNQSLLAVPLMVQGDTVGTLAVASPGTFSQDDVVSVAVVASQVAPLINQARLRSGLDESAQRFRDLYHALGCGVVVHGAAGEFVDANWAAENLLGVGHDVLSQDAFGAGWSIRLPNGGELLGPLRPPTAVSLYGRPIQGLVAEVTAPGGSPRWLRIDSNPVGAGAGTRWVVTSFFEVPAPAISEQGPIAQLK